MIDLFGLKPQPGLNLNLSFLVRRSKTKNHTDLGYTINVLRSKKNLG